MTQTQAQLTLDFARELDKLAVRADALGLQIKGNQVRIKGNQVSVLLDDISWELHKIAMGRDEQAGVLPKTDPKPSIWDTPSKTVANALWHAYLPKE